MKNEIEEFLAYLQKTEAYDEEQSFSYWPVEGCPSVTCCTNGARLIAKRFGGVIRGYSCSSVQDPRVGAWSYGHDFAIVGQYLVDYWGAFVDECLPTAVFHLIGDADLITRLYGRPSTWVAVPF